MTLSHACLDKTLRTVEPGPSTRTSLWQESKQDVDRGVGKWPGHGWHPATTAVGMCAWSCRGSNLASAREAVGYWRGPCSLASMLCLARRSMLKCAGPCCSSRRTSRFRARWKMPLASDSRQVAAEKGGGTGDVTEEAGGEHTQKGSNSDGRSEGRMQELRAAAAPKRETCAEATTWSSPRQGPNRSNEGCL